MIGACRLLGAGAQGSGSRVQEAAFPLISSTLISITRFKLLCECIFSNLRQQRICGHSPAIRREPSFQAIMRLGPRPGSCVRMSPLPTRSREKRSKKRSNLRASSSGACGRRHNCRNWLITRQPCGGGQFGCDDLGTLAPAGCTSRIDQKCLQPYNSQPSFWFALPSLPFWARSSHLPKLGTYRTVRSVARR
jgi:hypothetical protein